MSEKLDAEVIERLTRESVDPKTLTDGVEIVHTGQGTIQLYDLEKYQDRPRRPRGTIEVHNGESFVKAVEQRRVVSAMQGSAGDGESSALDYEPISLYSDEDRMALVAILNDDQGPDAGWRDHRVQLQLRKTPAWQRWVRGQGLKSQEEFALAIEAGEEEIVEPSPADMLSLAETFHATTSSRAKMGSKLANGKRQLVFEEDIDAKAGEDGTIVIPEKFRIAVRPFFGGERYEVTCRLRFRLREAKLVIGYELVRPDDVERAAFNDVVDEASRMLDVRPVAGPAPDVTHAGAYAQDV